MRFLTLAVLAALSISTYAGTASQDCAGIRYAVTSCPISGNVGTLGAPTDTGAIVTGLPSGIWYNYLYTTDTGVCDRFDYSNRYELFDLIQATGGAGITTTAATSSTSTTGNPGQANQCQAVLDYSSATPGTPGNYGPFTTTSVSQGIMPFYPGASITFRDQGPTTFPRVDQLTASDLCNAGNPHLTSYQISAHWADFEPTTGVYNWEKFESVIDRMNSNCAKGPLPVHIRIEVSSLGRFAEPATSVAAPSDVLSSMLVWQKSNNQWRARINYEELSSAAYLAYIDMLDALSERWGANDQIISFTFETESAIGNNIESAYPAHTRAGYESGRRAGITEASTRLPGKFIGAPANYFGNDFATEIPLYLALADTLGTIMFIYPDTFSREDRFNPPGMPLTHFQRYISPRRGVYATKGSSENPNLSRYTNWGDVINAAWNAGYNPSICDDSLNDPASNGNCGWHNPTLNLVISANNLANGLDHNAAESALTAFGGVPADLQTCPTATDALFDCGQPF